MSYDVCRDWKLYPLFIFSMIFLLHLPSLVLHQSFIPYSSVIYLLSFHNESIMPQSFINYSSTQIKSFSQHSHSSLISTNATSLNIALFFTDRASFTYRKCKTSPRSVINHLSEHSTSNNQFKNQYRHKNEVNRQH